MPIANFFGSHRAVNVNLAAHVATVFTGDSGTISTEAAVLSGENGFRIIPLLTVGETLAGTTGALNPLSAGPYAPAGGLDGIGAWRLDASTVRVLVNHELQDAAGYRISDGGGGSVPLSGARISYLDIDTGTMAIVDGGVAIRTIHDRAGHLVTAAGQLEVPGGLQSFCSAALIEAARYGADHGLADRIYFAGEEAASPSHPHGGTEWALDVATGALWAVPGFGRGKWENIAPFDTGDASHVAFLLDDDSSGAALYLYVGVKHPGGDFLDRNGLRDGQLYVWKSDSGEVSPSQFPTGTRAGSFVPVDARDATLAGHAGYDAAGYLDDTTLTAAADAVGAFSFRRPEDISANPDNPRQAVFATTGISGSSNHDGTIYTITVDFSDVDNPSGDVSVLYNSNLDPARKIRNPDNVEWSPDGFVYIQEDKATPGLFGLGAVNPHEASILRIDPDTAAVTRIAAIDRAAVPFGVTDSAAGEVGAWESSGILDVSALFGSPPGSLFLADVQAHSLVDGPIAAGRLHQGGQFVLIAAPGADVSPAAKVTALGDISAVIGSRFADTLIGDGAANRLRGEGGGDRIAGGDGDDVLRGGSGADLILGGAGHDRIRGGAGRDDMTGGADDDVFLFARAGDAGTKTGRADIIQDFAQGLDRIGLAAIDARPRHGDQEFRWIGTDAFHGKVGELRYRVKDAGGVGDDRRVITGDIDGDGRADLRLILTGLGPLDAGDFVL